MTVVNVVMSESDADTDVLKLSSLDILVDMSDPGIWTVDASTTSKWRRCLLASIRMYTPTKKIARDYSIDNIVTA